MPTILNATKVKADAERVLAVWETNADLKVSGSTLEQFQTNLTALNDATASIEREERKAEVTLTPLRNRRDDIAKKINATCVNARKSIGGSLGEDSSEYELAGGTRTSERKHGGRKTAKPATPAK